MKKLLHQDDSILFELNEELHAIEFRPRGLPHSTEHLKEAYHMLVSLCEQHIELYDDLTILIDIRETDGITAQDNEWIASEIVPKLIALGIKKLALIDGITELAHITSEEFMELSNRSPMQHLLFKDRESAVTWLQANSR